MANMYYETAWFAGPVDQMKTLREILTFRSSNGNDFVELNASDEATVGWDVSYDETPYSLSLTGQMRYDPLGASFYRISQRVPGLFMASSSHCVYDNRYLLVAGFGPNWHFFAEPPVFTEDWEPIPGITDDDHKLLDIVWDGFYSAYSAACKTFQRGGKMPRRALSILEETQLKYDENDP
ncbi:MAG TPA: hypothetical protein PLX06_14885, partial [Fimbriimonadaceae bacterium]|nr:hypothetical protein [Fimbriimonadaceae bacterium]